MRVSSRHVLRQGPMLAMLGKTAVRALGQRVRSSKASALATPGPECTRTLTAPSDELLDAYIRHVGGDPRSYRDSVPPHFFPHWVLPVAAETLRDVPYPILRVLNAGCRMQVRGTIARRQPLHVRAHLTHVDDDGARAILTQRVVSGTPSVPDALITDLFAYVPLGRKKHDNGHGDGSARVSERIKHEKPRVPTGAHEIGFMHLAADEGLSYAKLTGDFNPIHWLPPYARAAGFSSVILHGFATFARACETLVRGLFAGDVTRLAELEAKFTRALVLPHDVGVYVRDREVFVGDGIEGPAYLTGRFDSGDQR